MTDTTKLLVIGDLIGRFEYLNLSCDKCGRSFRFAVAKLVADRGSGFTLANLRGLMTKDCPRKGDACAASFPDFLKPLTPP